VWIVETVFKCSAAHVQSYTSKQSEAVWTLIVRRLAFIGVCGVIAVALVPQ